MVKVICKQCGKEFEAKLSSNAKFCSRACAGRERTGSNHPRWTKVKKECEQCGKLFQLQAWEVKKGRRFCSRRCMGQWRKENIKGENHPNWNGGGEIVTRICKQCGKEFIVTVTQIRQGNDKVCSRECADLFRRKSVIKVCTQCGKEFKSRPSEKQGKRIFCSKECYQEWQKQNKTACICKQCSKEFEIYVSRVRAGGGVFCSRKCMGQWTSEHQRGENHPRWEGPKVKVCKQCGKEFEVRWPGELSWRKCCSRECQGKWLSQNKSGENSSQWRGGKVKRVCEWCGKEFRVKPSQGKGQNGRFCSQPCSGRWKSKTFIGRDHWTWKEKIKKVCELCGEEFEICPSQGKYAVNRFCSQSCYHQWHQGKNCTRWKGGISFEPYGIEFNERLRQTIRKRDGYICTICKMSERDRNPTVHHIDYNKQNNDPSNLITLCCSCHTMTNENREYWQKVLSPLPHLHSLPSFHHVGGMSCLS